jgi:hypothetical protein
MFGMDGITLSLHSTFDETEFAFDFELINTTTYRRAFDCASRAKATNDESSKTEGLQKLPIQEKIVPDLIVFPKGDNIVEKLVAEEEDLVEELLTEGAQRLSNPGYNSNRYGDFRIQPPGNDNFTVPIFGKFATPQNQTRITTQKLHEFEIAELSSLSPEEPEHIPNSQQTDMSSEADIGEPVAKICQALDKMMFSEFEDVMPRFTWAADNSLRTSSQQLDRTMEEKQTPLIDLSIPETNEAEALKSSRAYEDLMEIDTQPLVPQISDKAVAQDVISGIVLKRTEALTLHDFLQNPPPADPLDRYLREQTLKSTVLKAGSTEQVTEDFSWKQLVSFINPLQPLSSLTQYKLEELVYSSASSKVIKGRKAGAAEVVRTPSSPFSSLLLNRGSLQSKL